MEERTTMPHGHGKQPNGRVIISGAPYRQVTVEMIEDVVQVFHARRFPLREVVVGRGGRVEDMAEQWAKALGIPVCSFAAHWQVYGEEAEETRDSQMIAYAGGLIAFLDTRSDEMDAFVTRAEEQGLAVLEVSGTYAPLPCRQPSMHAD